MTDRLSGFIVTLAEDTRVDDAEAIVNAIKMVKGVLNVQPIVSDVQQHIAESRVRRELGEKILAILYPKS